MTEDKYKVIGLFIEGKSASDIAKLPQIQTSYATLLRWEREFKEAVENNTLEQLVDMDKVLLAEITNELVMRQPEALQAAATTSALQINKLATAMELLQTDFISTAKALNAKIRSLSMSTENMEQLVSLTTALCNLQNAFFNKNMTQVNVQQNFGSSESKYSEFLND